MHKPIDAIRPNKASQPRRGQFLVQLGFACICLICLFPIVPGFIGVLSASLHYVPALNLTEVNLDGFAQVFTWSGVGQSLALSFFSAAMSTFLSILICFLILKQVWLTPKWNKLQTSLAPLLALPHVAFAVGFLLLLSPTGLLARFIQVFVEVDIPWLVRDPWGLGLIVSLTIKEVPFLLLMSASVLNQFPVQKQLQIAQSVGLSLNQAYWQVILPQWLPKMRFSIFAVLAFACSVVDMSLILAPSTPAPFAVLVFQWFSDGDLSLFPRAAAGAFVLFILCLSLLVGYRMLEGFFVSKARHWMYCNQPWFINPKAWIYKLILFTSLAASLLLVIWSFAQRWRFPDLLPSQWSLSFWAQEWPYLQDSLQNSIIIGLITSILATLLAIFAQEYRLKFPKRLPMLLIALPMLLPQLSILFGLQVFTLYLGQNVYLPWVLWAHVFFVFPYVYLSLDGPWKSFPDRYQAIGASLGLSPLKFWFKVKLPLLLPSILTAWAIGMSVSLAQYLSTLMLGGGRIATLTTEAVALASGYDRRLMALYALWQALLPLIFFILAHLLSQSYPFKPWSFKINTKQTQINKAKPYEPKVK